jgi:hypothetical protein
MLTFSFCNGKGSGQICIVFAAKMTHSTRILIALQWYTIKTTFY